MPLLLVAAGCTLPAERPRRRALTEAHASATADPAYVEAAAALEARHPARAESILAPLLGDPGRRTPWAVLLAARIAASDDRWARVDSLLRPPLADSGAQADARLLRARGALERGDAAGALELARLAGAVAPDEDTQGRARAVVARAYDRLGARDSARAAYASAATLLPAVSDWLWLRAAALERDSARRAAYYDKLQTAPAQARAPIAEAQTLEQTGRPRAAIGIYEEVGAQVSAMRLRAALASGRAERDRARRELVAYVRAHSGTDDARLAIEMLDEGHFELSDSEELVIARSALEGGPLSRAKAAIRHAFRDRSPTAEERLLLAQVLAEQGPEGRRQAMRVLKAVPRKSPLAGQAALARATLLRRYGEGGAARTAYRQVAKLYPRDTVAASGALLALAEMATDARRDDAARDAWLALVKKYPTSEHAPRARYEAAILAFAAGKLAVAASELDVVTDRSPEAPEAIPARYWSGRARLALHDSIGALERWDPLFTSGPASYYAGLAAQRTGDPRWRPTEVPDVFRSFRDVRDALDRVDLLDDLGMGLEARLEMDAMSSGADSSVEHVLAVGNAMRARGLMRRAMALGRKAVALGASDARAWRLVYPLDDARLVASEAARRGVDPALVAAVIRHESSFEPNATSPVGARGLMQVMPRIGAALAKAERIAPWDPGMLYDPDMNVRLGVLHLKAFTGHYPHPALALAAYNAGGSRVNRWSGRRGGTDPELFVERIRFAETRGYVRDVLVSRELYAVLYDWKKLAGEGMVVAEREPEAAIPKVEREPVAAIPKKEPARKFF